jgi:hypothetical protein
VGEKKITLPPVSSIFWQLSLSTQFFSGLLLTCCDFVCESNPLLCPYFSSPDINMISFSRRALLSPAVLPLLSFRPIRDSTLSQELTQRIYF